MGFFIDFIEVVTFPYFSIRWFVFTPLLPIRQQTVDLGNFERLVSAVRTWHVDFLVAPLQLISSMSKHNCPCLNIATIQNLHSSHSQKIICRYYKHVLMLPKFGDQNLLDKLTVCNFVEILDVWVSCLTMIQILKNIIPEQKSSSEWTLFIEQLQICKVHSGNCMIFHLQDFSILSAIFVCWVQQFKPQCF